MRDMTMTAEHVHHRLSNGVAALVGQIQSGRGWEYDGTYSLTMPVGVQPWKIEATPIVKGDEPVSRYKLTVTAVGHTPNQGVIANVKRILVPPRFSDIEEVEGGIAAVLTFF